MSQLFSQFNKYYEKSCSECGYCFRNCYAFKKSKYPIYKDIKRLLSGQSTNKEVKKIRRFLKSCVYCKECQRRCKNGLDLTERMAAIKYALKQRVPNYVWLPNKVPLILGKLVNGKRYAYFVQYFVNELIPSKIREKYEEYREPKKRDIVFFSGCGIQALENQFYSLLESFRTLNINFGLIEGMYKKHVCCGAVLFDLGKFDYGLVMLKNLVNEIKKFGTKKVVVYCATCYYGLKRLAPQLIENYDLEVSYVTEYFANLLKDPKIKRSLATIEQTITVHDSCHLALSGDISSVRNLINELPGAEISEMQHNKRNALCDASLMIAGSNNLFKPLYKKKYLPIVREAIDTQADVLCTLCPGCHAVLSIFGDGLLSNLDLKRKAIYVKNWASIFAEYLGININDRLTYRFTHLLTIPFKNSGAWYLWKAMKALVNGYIGKKPHKHLQS